MHFMFLRFFMESRLMRYRGIPRRFSRLTTKLTNAYRQIVNMTLCDRTTRRTSNECEYQRHSPAT